MNDEPPPATVVAVPPMVRGPSLPTPALRGAPPASETIDVGGRVMGPDGQPLRDVLVFASGIEEYDYPRAGGTVSIPVTGAHAVATQLGQRVVMHAGDARLHTMVVRPLEDARLLFNVPVLASGTPAALPFDERTFGIHVVECSIHRGERAYVGVFAHPFHQLVGADGRFAFRRLPRQARKIHAFHSHFGERVVPLDTKGAPPEMLVTLGEKGA